MSGKIKRNEPERHGLGRQKSREQVFLRGSCSFNCLLKEEEKLRERETEEVAGWGGENESCANHTGPKTLRLCSTTRECPKVSQLVAPNVKSRKSLTSSVK